MRKLNAVLGPVMIILLLIHAISGALQLWGMIPGGNVIRDILSRALLVIVAVHVVIGIKLTIDTIAACAKAGKSYFKNNERFWIARISGFAMLALIIYHVIIFSGGKGETFRLNSFQWVQLCANILLVVTLVIHLITNIKPLFISLGIADRKYVRDIMIILSVVLLICSIAFLYYYLRWNVLWKMQAGQEIPLNTGVCSSGLYRLLSGAAET